MCRARWPADAPRPVAVEARRGRGMDRFVAMTTSTGTGERTLAQLVHGTLARNWREGERDGVHYAYTVPEPGPLPVAVVLGLVLRAIAWRRFDPARSRARARVAAGRRSAPDGFIGHTIFWQRPAARQPRAHLQRHLARRAPMTASIQPPLLAWAWSIAVGDPARGAADRPPARLARAHRELEGDGLLWIMQPDESGLDASPSSIRSGAGARRARPGSRCWCGATGASALTCGAIARRRRAGVLRGRSPTCCTASRGSRWGARR